MLFVIIVRLLCFVLYTYGLTGAKTVCPSTLPVLLGGFIEDIRRFDNNFF